MHASSAMSTIFCAIENQWIKILRPPIRISYLSQFCWEGCHILPCILSTILRDHLRVPVWENRAEVGRRGSANLHHISAVCFPYGTSIHGNIHLLIDVIVFEKRPPPPKKLPQWGGESSDFEATSAVNIFWTNYTAEMIWHMCNTCRFRIKVNGRARVNYLLLTFCEATNDAPFTTFLKISK